MTYSFRSLGFFPAGGSRTVLEQLSFPPPLAPLLLLSSSPLYLLITIPPDVSHPKCPSLAVTLTPSSDCLPVIRRPLEQSY